MTQFRSIGPGQGPQFGSVSNNGVTPQFQQAPTGKPGFNTGAGVDSFTASSPLGVNFAQQAQPKGSTNVADIVGAVAKMSPNEAAGQLNKSTLFGLKHF